MKLYFISWHLLPVWQRGFCQSKTFLFPKTCHCLAGTLSSSVNALQKRFVQGSAEISHERVPTQFQLVIKKKTYHYSFCMISCSREIGCLKAFTFYVPPPFEDPAVEKKNRNNVMWLLVLIAPPRTFCETSHCKVSFITNEWRSKFYMQMWCSLWCCQPRFQSSSSSSILNVTSPVKLVRRLSARFQVSSAHSESANWPQKEALVPAMGERNTTENLFFFFSFYRLSRESQVTI